MNKQIIFIVLIITSTVSHGMKRPASIIQNNNAAQSVGILLQDDLLPQLTANMCSNHNYQPKIIKNAIKIFSLTSKYFHDYYAQEKVKQEIIDLCLPHHNSNSKDIAHNLGCHAIHAKIERFTKIARKKDKEFSANDLKDPWYLAVTTTYKLDYNIYQEPLNQSLLYVAIDHWQLQKAITILEKTKNLHFNYGDAQNPLLKIAQHRRHYVNGIIASVSPQTQDLQQLLIIAEKLLQKGILPDSRNTMRQYTSLLYSVERDDKEFVRLLLKYHADPSLTRYDAWKKKMVNAFDLEPEEGWLQAIIDEVNANKQLKTTHSPVDQSGQK